MNRVDRIYKFTNENLTAYQELFDFNGKKVLSVIGSGDQYFTSILYGAKEVTVFDKNPLAAYYLIFKYAAIKVFSYEEFIKFFFTSNMRNISLYNKLRLALPHEVRDVFDKYFKVGINSITNPSLGLSKKVNYKTGRIIPYLSEENYLLLKEKLNENNFPKVKVELFENLYNCLDGTYDIMLFSNIFCYLGITADEFSKYMDIYMKYLNPNGIVQANYVWNKESEYLEGFFYGDYKIEEIPAVSTIGNNYVATLRKKC